MRKHARAARKLVDPDLEADALAAFRFGCWERAGRSTGPLSIRHDVVVKARGPIVALVGLVFVASAGAASTVGVVRNRDAKPNQTGVRRGRVLQ